MEYKKLLNDMLAQSQLSEFPTELLTTTIHTWKGDINPEKDWDDFVGGQLVNHLYYENTYSIGVDNVSLEFGNNATSFYSLLTHNTQIECYSNKSIDLTGKFITLGTDRDTIYMALSYELNNFKLKNQKTKPYLTKIILVDVVKQISQEMDDGNVSPTINFAFGKLGEEITIPVLKEKKDNEINGIDIEEWTTKQITNPKFQNLEILINAPAVMTPFDIIKNETGNVLDDRRVEPNKASTKPKTFPINPHMCILPTQFNLFGIDNYGFNHPADTSNIAKMISATNSIASATNTGLSLGSGWFGRTVQGIGQAGIGLGQKFFGDKGTLANSSALVPKIVSSESDGLKFFIQGDGIGSFFNDNLTEDGYLNLENLYFEQDYIEINQANGEFGKYGKSMSPSNNEQFDSMTIYRALGLNSIVLKDSYIPALATPYADGKYSGLKIDDKKIDNYFKFGVPRLKIGSGNVLPPMVAPETWEVYIRNMFFRPDPYSFWNWPLLMPAEIGVYNVEKKTSINYDTTVGASLSAIGSIFQGAEESGASSQLKSSYWNKTILLSQLSNNDLYDPNKTFTSIRYEFKEDDFNHSQGATNPQTLYQFQCFIFTQSEIQINLLDKDNKVIRTHIFNSQGKNMGNAASPLSIFQF